MSAPHKNFFFSFTVIYAFLLGELILPFLPYTRKMFLIWIDEYEGAEILSCYSLFHQEDTLSAFWSEKDPPLQEINPEN